MPFPEGKPPLVVILGPTAVGKTELSLRLAEALDGEIVSADSRLFYRGMDIGTAKPTLEERRRVPHHLIDVANPDETWSLSVFQAAAEQAILSVHKRGKIPLLVGGTGQYIRAVTEGWAPPAQAPDIRMRRALEDWARSIGPEGLHRRLAVIDPAAANKILPGNLRRSIRALEVIYHTGRRFSEQQQRSESPYSLVQIGIIRPREELYARIDARIEAMFEAGFVDEVRRLLENGYPCALPTMSAIGYGEVCAYIRGDISLEEAVMLIKRRTRQFVRRQSNWFRLEDENIRWFNAGDVRLNGLINFVQEKVEVEWKNPG